MNVNFSDSDLSYSNFHGAICRDANFSGSNTHGCKRIMQYDVIEMQLQLIEKKRREQGKSQKQEHKKQISIED